MAEALSYLFDQDIYIEGGNNVSARFSPPTLVEDGTHAWNSDGKHELGLSNDVQVQPVPPSPPSDPPS